ncbi:MAG: DEAD/DEAH box helicase, partial [Euryarchaeota archaeon]|nr:DEAD/DEAH box helicase [Euryarchaeota archaeon]
RYIIVSLCRFCLMDDVLTWITDENRVKIGDMEEICLSCAEKELRREVSHMGRVGRSALRHLDELLLRYRDVDRVLAMIEPDAWSMEKTLYDRLEAHPVLHTMHIDELPLPRPFVEASQVTSLMPVQQLAVEAGLLYGKDLLIVSATASGKTFIGELAGLKNILEKRGRLIFLVSLVALAFQKYERFLAKYGDIASVSIITGRSRIHVKENNRNTNRDKNADIIIATYEGIDTILRRGDMLSNIGTVVIDEVQMLEDSERGHRLDGLIARLKYSSPKAQFLYLSATIGLPNHLAKKLTAKLVRYDERPVSLDRYLVFIERKEKIPTEKQLIDKEYKTISSKGFRGQTIVFTNARIRCHQIAEKVGGGVAPYHAGLSQEERRTVESQFEKGELKAVITTAALAAGVDFPASQVIFDSLAMGISWLSVQEFYQMSGRAGRPDYHDLGKVVILAEVGGSYDRSSRLTEEEVAMLLLKGEMEEVAPIYSIEQSSEVYSANAVVARGDRRVIHKIEESVVGKVQSVEDLLIREGFLRISNDRVELSDMGRVMAEHFIGVERLLEIMRLVKEKDDALDIVAELECTMDEKEKKQR